MFSPGFRPVYPVLTVAPLASGLSSVWYLSPGLAFACLFYLPFGFWVFWGFFLDIGFHNLGHELVIKACLFYTTCPPVWVAFGSFLCNCDRSMWQWEAVMYINQEEEKAGAGPVTAPSLYKSGQNCIKRVDGNIFFFGVFLQHWLMSVNLLIILSINQLVID